MKQSVLTLLLIFLPFLPSFAQETSEEPAAPDPDVVAVVNGVTIPRADYDAALAEFMRSNRIPDTLEEEQMAQVKQTVLDGLIGTELLYQKAMSIPIEVPQAEIQGALQQVEAGMGGAEAFAATLESRGKTREEMVEMLRRNLTVQKMIQEQVLTSVVVNEVDVRQYYDQNPDEMKQPAAVRASHIFVESDPSDDPEARAEARKKIDDALRRVKLGTDFGDIARLVSEDGSAARGGDMGWVARGKTVPIFEEVLYALEVGQASDVFETPKGFHIVKATDKREAGTAAFEDVRQGIEDYLKQVRSVEALESMVASLRAEGAVEVF